MRNTMVQSYHTNRDVTKIEVFKQQKMGLQALPSHIKQKLTRRHSCFLLNDVPIHNFQKLSHLYVCFKELIDRTFRVSKLFLSSVTLNLATTMSF